jgi:hypothetical protein
MIEPQALSGMPPSLTNRIQNCLVPAVQRLVHHPASATLVTRRVPPSAARVLRLACRAGGWRHQQPCDRAAFRAIKTEQIRRLQIFALNAAINFGYRRNFGFLNVLWPFTRRALLAMLRWFRVGGGAACEWTELGRLVSTQMQLLNRLREWRKNEGSHEHQGRV